MSWLNLRKQKKEEPKTAPAVAPVPVKRLAVREERTPAALSATVGTSGARVLLRPRVTEKATTLAERGVYAFEVVKDATEREVKTAIRALYKVSPVKVAFLPLRSKEIIVKGKKGRTKGGKKAYVYLKPGQKIEVI